MNAPQLQPRKQEAPVLRTLSVLLYGIPKVGKTTEAAKFPGALLLNCEPSGTDRHRPGPGRRLDSRRPNGCAARRHDHPVDPRARLRSRHPRRRQRADRHRTPHHHAQCRRAR